MESTTETTNNSAEQKKKDDKKMNYIFLGVTIVLMLLVFIGMKMCS
jgi:hypothetical protein